ncbi:hypothetical protein [Aeromicrobium endophyticum]|uniref:Htaa domain-containing protein n=1 Tax=Aeromicrobium endophyticum TaxID=2292704 RepID=A0A371P5R4_9ACTN|nr:hypothetical protein [Aeromicrobium endophyticum]REK70880.1 hypothetical protein DX116_17525 [Aeromicrobium endophyticum]
MRSEIRTALAVLVTSAVLLGSATMALAADGDPGTPGPIASEPASPSTSAPTSEPTPSPSSEPTDAPTSEPTDTPTTPAPTTPPVPTGAFSVSDAQLRWGLNDESNNKAFAPGTFNFFSAGKIADPGKGNTKLTSAGWKQTDGHVAIKKYLKGSWTPATWAGLQTDTEGRTMTSTNGPFSGHEVVIGGGTGTVDPTKGSATIRWSGSFTVLYYSGYSFFYVTDPQLTVANGIGTLTATLSGYGSSMDDLSQWKPVAPQPGVVLADLRTVDLSADLGFSVTPEYRGVDAPEGSVQTKSSPDWGSFPKTFVAFQNASGTGSYWYSSGGAADAHKVAKPVTVSYAAGSPLTVKPPVTQRKKSSGSGPGADRPLAQPVQPATAPASPLALPAPVAPEAVLGAAPVLQTRPVSAVHGLRAAPDRSTDTTGVWILGGALLAASALVGVAPFVYSATRTER